MGALAAAGIGLSLMGQYGQTQANVQAARSASANSEVEAKGIEDAAALQERQFRRKAGLAAGEGRAIAAASGYESGSGSPLLLQLDLAKQTEMEALGIRRSGQVAAEGKRYEGRLAKASIPGAIVGGIGNAGTILSTFFARR